MKKMALGIACAALIAAILTGCGGDGSVSTTATSATAVSTSTTEATSGGTSASTTQATSAAASTLGGIRYGDYMKQQEEAQASRKASAEVSREVEEQKRLEELTVIDNETCLVRYSGEITTKSGKIDIGVYLENRSENTNYEFRVSRGSINGIEVETYMSVEVKPGKKANDKISFRTDILEKFGFTDFTAFEIELEVRDADDWLADPILTETMSAYKENAASVEPFDLEMKAGYKRIIDNEYATITVVGNENDKIRGYVVWLYIQNKSDCDIAPYVENASINGYMIDPILSADVLPEKSTFARMYWDQDDLDNNKIASVEEIEIDLTCRDNNDWLSGELFSETAIFTP